MPAEPWRSLSSTARSVCARRSTARRKSSGSKPRWAKAPCTGCGNRARKRRSPARPTRNRSLGLGDDHYQGSIAFLDGRAGLEPFTDARIKDPEAKALAAKIGYVIDPDNEYPRNYTGHLTATLQDGRTVTAEQPFLRGGQHAPLDDAELQEKFFANAAFGGWDPDRAKALHGFCSGLFDLDGFDGLARFAG